MAHDPAWGRDHDHMVGDGLGRVGVNLVRHRTSRRLDGERPLVITEIGSDTGRPRPSYPAHWLSDTTSNTRRRFAMLETCYPEYLPAGPFSMKP